MEEKKRCRWCNLKNPLYVAYHDEEWGVLNTDEHYLYEMLILESFQAGLSWECVLNKRENFRAAYANFDIDMVCAFDEAKVQELLSNPGLIRNRLKVRASIKNSGIFRDITQEFGSFFNYLTSFQPALGMAAGSVLVENDKTTNALSDAISADLYKRGMRFVGSTIIYSYLQAIGLVNSHDEGCGWKKVDEG